MGEDDWQDMCEAPSERLRQARKQLSMIKMMLMSEPHDDADRQEWDAINEWLTRAEEQLDRLAITEEHPDLDGNGHQFSMN